MASTSSAVTDASFLNAAGRVDSEELKAPDLEYGRTQDSANGAYANTSFQPLEIEDGAAKAGLEKAEGGKVVEDGGAVQKKGVCARYRGWFICLGSTLAILVIAAITIPLLWYTEPTAELLSQSNLRIDGSGSIGVDLKLKIHNPNRYPVAFQNLQLDIYDMNNVHIGQVTRKERQRVPARGSAVTTAKATIQASIIELIGMGLDCLANDNQTKIRIKGTADGRLSGKKIVQVVGPFEQMTQCVTLNVPGRTGGGGAAGAGGGQQPGIGNGQIIQGIGEVINDVFGGGRPRPAAPPAPAAAAPAPGK